MATEWDSEQSNDVVYTFVPFHSFFFCFLRIANFFVGTHPIPLWMGAKREHENGWKSQRAHFFFLLDSLLGACAELGTVNVYVKCALGFFFVFVYFFVLFRTCCTQRFYLSHSPDLTPTTSLFPFHISFPLLWWRRWATHNWTPRISSYNTECIFLCCCLLAVVVNIPE